jgi:hypothetical protein
MLVNTIKFLSLTFVLCAAPLRSVWAAQAQQENAPYLVMAPLDQYLRPNEASEIALARSAAPASISDGAEIKVLRREGYTTATKGTNGFVCIVERSWGAATDEPEFWNSKVRAPVCFNPPAARTFLPIYLMKTKVVLARKSKKEIVQTIASALDKASLAEVLALHRKGLTGCLSGY